MILLGLILVLISGMAESVMDSLQFHYHKSIFKDFENQLFWNPLNSWRNKWKNGDPKQGEKFLGSSTLFVGLTDAWHLFKTIHNLTIFLGLFFIAISQVSILWMILCFIIARIIFGLSFTFFFDFWSSDN
jgi:hypothetical protein